MENKKIKVAFIGLGIMGSRMAKELFANAKKEGLGRLDFAAIHKYLEGSH